MLHRNSQMHKLMEQCIDIAVFDHWCKFEQTKDMHISAELQELGLFNCVFCDLFLRNPFVFLAQIGYLRFFDTEGVGCFLS